MFNVHVPAAETYKIHMRPAIYQSLATILDYFNINQKHKIYFNGEAEVSKLIGGLFDSRRGDDTKTDMGYDDKIFIEVDVDYSGYNDELDSESRGTGTVPPMWYDPMTKSKIRTVYTNRKIEVTINKFFKDRTTAQTFHRNIRSGLLSSQIPSTFEVETHYPIPMSILHCYQDIYDRLVAGGAVDGSENFLTWFRKNSLTKTDIISNLVGNNDCLVFLQPKVDNGIEYGPVNFAKVNTGRYIGQFEVSWNYSFYWNEHTKWGVEYPIQVYQSPMPEEWIPTVRDVQRSEPVPRRFLESRLGMAIFGKGVPINPFYNVLPEVDNWRPPAVGWLAPQLQVLVSMEATDGEQVILNINNIVGFTWNEKFIHYILKYHDKVTTHHKSPLNFRVYSDDVPILDYQIKLRPNGDLVLTRPATLKNIHRVVFSIDYALRQWDEGCVDDLLEDPEYGKWIFDTLYPAYEVPSDWGENGMIDWIDSHNDIEVGDGPEIDFFNTYMMGSVIIAKREGQRF